MEQHEMRTANAMRIHLLVFATLLCLGAMQAVHSQEWTPPMMLPGPLNQLPPYNKRFPSINASLDTIYFSAEEGIGDEIFYSYRYQDSLWSEAIRIDAFSDDRSKESVSIGPGDSTIYFSAWGGEGGYGGWDIWVSHRGANGQWQPAVNAGPNINSGGTEWGVFLNRRADKLYFSGTRLPPGNGLNILVSEWENGQWGGASAIEGEVNNFEDQEHVTLPEDESFLVLTMRRWAATHIDLWTCYPTDSGWTEPDQVEELAGVANEEGASLSPDGNTMFFARQIDVGWTHRLFVTYRIDSAVPREREKNTMDGTRISPNPTNGNHIRIRLNDEFYRGGLRLGLFNTLGQRIPFQGDAASQIGGDFILELPTLPTGQYFLNISNSRTSLTSPLTIIR